MSSTVKSTKIYTEKYNQALADADMDLKYGQYLQMIFLESEAKKAMELRSQNAMETFRKLCHLIVQHFSTMKSETQSLQMISILVQICEHIKKQEDILKPLIEAIPSLVTKYENLGNAVSIVKNKLNVKDLQVPRLGHEGEVCALLEEMQAFLLSFSEQGPRYKRAISTVDAFQDYVQSYRVLTDALKMGFALMMEARSAAFSQASLALVASE